MPNYYLRRCELMGYSPAYWTYFSPFMSHNRALKRTAENTPNYITLDDSRNYTDFQCFCS